ncbi:PREDICTED: protein split ends-like [Priapulus caudatus]|uniref:Protein split ends-like n=1 Tax=Priapulus caudatus TaxID=37621 RepID=A0ABM1EYF8_PRICU|nr:PREDICTED: protein split ends-like [Priapulus caudatus]
MLAETGGLALAGAGLAITTIVVLIYAVAICVCCQQRPKCEAVKIDQLISVRAENTLDVPPVQNQDLTTSVVNAEPDSGRYSNGDAPSSPTASPENNVMNTSSTSSEIRHENKTSRRLPEPPPLVTREDSAASSEGATADVNRDVQGVDNESELYASVSDDVAVQVSLDARGRPEPPYAKVKKPNAAAEPEPPYSKVTPPFTAVQGAIQGSGEDSAGYTIVREPAPDYSTAEPEDVYESVQDAEAPPPVPAKNFSPDEMECDASPGAVGGYPPGIAPASVTAVQSTSRADSKESSYFSIGIREPLENLKAREQTRQLERERQQNVVTTSGASTDEEHYYTTVHSDYGDSDMYAQVGPRVTVEARDGTTHESGCNSPASELYAEIDARSGGQGSNRSSLYAKVNYGSAGNSRHDPPPEPPAVERLYNITYGMASAPTVPSTPPPRASSRPASEHVSTSPTLSTSVTDLYAVVDRSRKKTNKRRSSPGVDSPDGGRSRHSVPDGAGGRPPGRRAPDARCRGDKTGSLTRHVSGALYCSSASITFIDDIDDADDDSDDDGGEPNYSTVEETVAAATGPLVVTHSRQSSLNYEESWQQLEQQSSGAAGETANPHGLVHISRHRPTANLWMRPEHIYQELDPELVRRRKDSAQKKARRKQEEEEKRMMLQELEEEGEKKRRSHWEVEEEERRRSHHRELEKKDKRSSHRETEEGEKRRSHRELEEEERRRSHRELEEEDKRMRRKREEEEEEKSMLWARERKEEEMQWTDSVQRKARRKREEEEKDAEEEKSRTRQGWESKEQEMQWLDSMQRKARREREEEEVKQRKMQRKRESQEEEEQQRKMQRERGSHEDENQHQRHSAQVSPHREWEKGEDERRRKEMRERRSNPGSGVEGYDDMEEELSTRF